MSRMFFVIAAVRTALAAGVCIGLAALSPASARPAGAGERAEGAPPRVEQLVVVWGFRIRAEPYDTRKIALREGFEDVANREACRTSTCGFLAVHRDGAWHVTTVRAAPEAELVAMSREVESDQATAFVIVHPPGDRLKPPYLF